MRYPLDTQYELLKHELKQRYLNWDYFYGNQILDFTDFSDLEFLFHLFSNFFFLEINISMSICNKKIKFEISENTSDFQM